jgi:hypothetical protein
MCWIGFQYKNANFGDVGTKNESKIKKLLTLHRPGTVLPAKWLETLGISRDLQVKWRLRIMVVKSTNRSQNV